MERRLKYATQYLSDESREGANAEKGAFIMETAELYRLAGLVYLYRAAEGLPTTAAKVRAVVEPGLELLRSMDVCDRNFPVTIIGCEALGDEERTIVLDLLSRTRARCKAESLVFPERFVKASWAQDDLSPDRDLDYVTKFDAIMSRSNSLPSFA